MSTEENKALVRLTLEEAENRRNLSVFDEYVASDCVNYRGPHMLPSRTTAELKQVMADVLSASPDNHVTIHDMLAEGDEVAARWTITRTQGGKRVTISELGIWRIADGKVVETWIIPTMIEE